MRNHREPSFEALDLIVCTLSLSPPSRELTEDASLSSLTSEAVAEVCSLSTPLSVTRTSSGVAALSSVSASSLSDSELAEDGGVRRTVP